MCNIINNIVTEHRSNINEDDSLLSSQTFSIEHLHPPPSTELNQLIFNLM